MSQMGSIMVQRWNKLLSIYRAFDIYKKHILPLLFLRIISGFTETLSLALIFPLLAAITNTGTSSDVQFSSVVAIKQYLPAWFTDKNLVTLFSLLFLFAIILKFIIFICNEVYSRYVTSSLQLHWVDKIFNYYNFCDYNTLTKKQMGELIHNCTKETNAATIGLWRILELIKKLILVIMLFIALMFTNWVFTSVLTVFAMVFILLFSRRSREYTKKLGSKIQRINQSITNQISDSLVSSKEVRLFNLQSSLREKLLVFLQSYRSLIIRMTVALTLPNAVGELLLGMVACVTLLYITNFTSMSIASLIPLIGMYALMAQKLVSNASQVFSLFLGISAMIPSIDLIEKLITEADAANKQSTDENEKFVFTSVSQPIEIKNLSYSYDKENQVFKNISLTIPQRKTTAIIGPSGVGKSTLLDLFIGLLEPCSGEIRVNGKNLKDIDVFSWRSKIAFVSQQSLMFSMSIADNIRMGKLDATEEEIINAAKLAYADRFINELPKKYDTVIGSTGAGISGGQKQRVALARSFIRNAEILILDEPTSALDESAENIVQDTIATFRGKKTILVVAHRGRTIEMSDNIINLENLPGVIKERTSSSSEKKPNHYETN